MLLWPTVKMQGERRDVLFGSYVTPGARCSRQEQDVILGLALHDTALSRYLCGLLGKL